MTQYDDYEMQQDDENIVSNTQYNPGQMKALQFGIDPNLYSENNVI